jgi:hypothetical protein
MQSFRQHNILSIDDTKLVALPATWGEDNRGYLCEFCPRLN